MTFSLKYIAAVHALAAKLEADGCTTEDLLSAAESDDDTLARDIMARRRSEGPAAASARPLLSEQQVSRFLGHILQGKSEYKHYLRQHTNANTLRGLSDEQTAAIFHLTSQEKIGWVPEDFARIVGLSKNEFDRLISEAKEYIIASATRQYMQHQEKLADQQYQDTRSIQEDEVDGFSSQTRTALLDANINYLAAFTELTEADVYGLHGVGAGRFNEIMSVLEANGYSLREG